MRSIQGGVAAVSRYGTIAETKVSEHAEEVVVEFWLLASRASPRIREELLQRTLADLLLEPCRRIVLCIPRGDWLLVHRGLDLISDARARVAGVTCLIEGWIGLSEQGSATTLPVADGER